MTSVQTNPVAPVTISFMLIFESSFLQKLLDSGSEGKGGGIMQSSNIRGAEVDADGFHSQLSLAFLMDHR